MVEINERINMRENAISDPIGLQLDNLVHNKHGEVDRISWNTFNAWRHPQMGGDYGYYGIPLDADWLEKLRFEYLEYRGKWQRSDFIFQIEEGVIGYNLLYASNPIECRPIKYVHELQNIYQSTTGMELF